MWRKDKAVYLFKKPLISLIDYTAFVFV